MPDIISKLRVEPGLHRDTRAYRYSEQKIRSSHGVETAGREVCTSLKAIGSRASRRVRVRIQPLATPYRALFRVDEVDGFTADHCQKHSAL